MGVTSITAVVSAGTDVLTFQGDPPEGQTCQAASRIERKQPEKNQTINIVNAMHVMEQRIDSYLTKEPLTQESDQVAVHDLQTESTDLTGPEFNMRRRLSEQSESKQDKRMLKFGSVLLAVHEAYHKQEWPEEDPTVQNSGTRSPISITDSVTNNREIGSIALARRPTFGGRPNRHKPRDSNGSTTVDRIARSDTRSSLSQPRSRTQSPSNYTPPDKQLGTPGAYPYSQSFFTSTPSSQTEIATNTGEESLPSPHTFGIPTPPHAKARQDMKRESHFNFQQVPPPLPPLNHPAFREKASEFGVLLEIHEDKAARHSHSLPSLAQARNVVKEELKSANKKTRQRSKSSTGENTAEKTRPEQPKWAFHSRTSSKSSVLSSRRSSAEYSAQQASSLHRDGCWEVDVSKAIIGLSLGGGPKNENIRVSASNVSSLTSRPTERWEANIAITGNACGDNVGTPSLLAVTIVLHP